MWKQTTVSGGGPVLLAITLLAAGCGEAVDPAHPAWPPALDVAGDQTNAERRRSLINP